MTALTVYGLKTCDTCRKAIKALEAAGHILTIRDIRADGVAADDLAAWLGLHGDVLVNTRSTTWRGLDDAARERKDSDPVGLLADNPTLMKRPVIVDGKNVHVGWTGAVQSVLLGSDR